jgi:hypothetical protein
MAFVSSSVMLYITIAIGILFVLFWMVTRKNLQTIGIKTNSKIDIIHNSFLITGLVMAMTAIGFLTCQGSSKVDSYRLSTMVYVIVLLTLSLFTFIGSLVAIADDALKKGNDTVEKENAKHSLKTWLTWFSVVSGINVGLSIAYLVFQLRKRGGGFSPVDGATLSPVDGATLSPVDGATLSPVDGATLSPVDGATLSPVDGATMSPVDGATLSPVDGATMSPSFGFDFQF